MKDIHIDSSATSSLSYGAQGNLSIWQEFETRIVINAFSNCQVLMNGTYPAALDLNQLIDSTGTWIQPNYEILNNGTEGNWIGVTDKYLGVRVKDGAQWLYGWIRLDVNTAGTSVTIKDYACNRTPNALINAGQLVTGINDSFDASKDAASVYPNPFNSWAIIKTSKALNNASLRIYNMMGQVLKTTPTISGDQIKIDRENLNSGLYFYELKQNTQIISTGKLLIMD